MTTVFDIFGNIEDEIKKPEKMQGPAPWTKKLTLHEGKYYIVRLLPYIKDGKDSVTVSKKSILKEITYRFLDSTTHKATYVVSPLTYGEPCPFNEYATAWKAAHQDKDMINEFNARLQRSQKRLINALLIDTDDDIKGKKEDDKTAKQRIGEVVVLQVPNTLWSVIAAGARGEYDKQLTESLVELNPSAREIKLARDMWDLSPNGMNLRITSQHVDKLGGYADYGVSTFTWSKRDLKRSDDEIEKLLNECTDLYKISRHYTYDEAETILKAGFLGQSADKTKKQDEDIVIETVETDSPKVEDIPKASSKPKSVDNTITEDKLNEIDSVLADIDDLDIDSL